MAQEINQRKQITLEALDASIAHWRDNAEKAAHRSLNLWEISACGLCHVFAHDETPEDECCVMCPVALSTGYRGCQASPFTMVLRSFKNKKVLVDSVQKELSFLIKLKEQIESGALPLPHDMEAAAKLSVYKE